jgi:hypothetical protein
MLGSGGNLENDGFLQSLCADRFRGRHMPARPVHVAGRVGLANGPHGLPAQRASNRALTRYVLRDLGDAVQTEDVARARLFLRDRPRVRTLVALVRVTALL